jgi:hypothetical protein
MSRVTQLKSVAIAAATIISLVSYAHADPLMDRLRNDPSIIKRSTTNNPNMKLLNEPEFTGSLRVEGAEHSLTSICSYDTFYWNTVYACNPEYNPADPVYIEKNRNHHENDDSSSSSGTAN